VTLKHGRLAEVLWGSATAAQDVSAFLNSISWQAQVDTAKVSTFKSSWHSFISGNAVSSATMNGYYDSTLTNIRGTLQAAPGVLSYAPAGATAIGDQVRLLSFNTVTYNENASVSDAVGFDWTAAGTAPAGIGVSLHPLASENVGTITGTGDGVLTSVAGTGLIAHLHVTVYTSGTHQFKLQDATTQGGAYTDIAGAAFTNMTSAGAQRLVVLGTVRQFVRCVATIGTAAATYSVSCARFPT